MRSLLAPCFAAVAMGCTTIHTVGGGTQPGQFYVVTSKSFLVFATSPMVLSCTLDENGVPTCVRVLTAKQAAEYQLSPYEAWMERGEELGNSDAYTDRPCSPESACQEATEHGASAVKGCIDGYRQSYIWYNGESSCNETSARQGDPGGEPAPENDDSPASSPSTTEE